MATVLRTEEQRVINYVRLRPRLDRNAQIFTSLAYL